MKEIYIRVCEWNAARYERDFNEELTLSLLHEEFTEWLEAPTAVDELDALCDIVYVTMGAIWKLNCIDYDQDAAQHQANVVVQKQINNNELKPALFIATYLTVMKYDKEYPYLNSLYLILTSALCQMTGFGLTNEQCIEALSIVCDSNDSKSVTKTASDVKANLDKGVTFIAPEPRLQALLEERRAKFN